MKIVLLLTTVFAAANSARQGWSPDLSTCSIPSTSDKNYVKNNCQPMKNNRNNYLNKKTYWSFTASQRSQCKYLLKKEVIKECKKRNYLPIPWDD